MNFSRKELIAIAFGGVLVSFVNAFAVSFVAGLNPANRDAFDPLFVVVMVELLASFGAVLWFARTKG